MNSTSETTNHDSAKAHRFSGYRNREILHIFNTFFHNESTGGILLLICAVPLALFYPAYMLGNGSRGVGATFAWSMKQGFHFWGGTFLVTLVCYLLTSIVGGVCSVPWYIVYIFRLLSGMPETDFVSLHGNTFLSVLQFLFGIIMLYGTYLASVVVMLGVTYQYGHIREKTDAVTVTDDIEHFDTL